MKTFNIAKVQREFLMLSDYHFIRVTKCIKDLDIDSQVQAELLSTITQFKTDLFEMARFSPLNATI